MMVYLAQNRLIGTAAKLARADERAMTIRAFAVFCGSRLHGVLLAGEPGRRVRL
jgi:hypothetical protein